MSKPEQERPTSKQGTSRIPHFQSVEEAAEFWDSHDSAEFEDEFTDVPEARYMVKRGRANKAITVRVDEQTLASLTEEASQKGIGPSTLVRMWILEHVGDRRQHAPSHDSKALL